VPGTAHFLLGRTFRRLIRQSLGKLKKTREEATAFLLLPPPGNSGLNSAIPAGAEGLGSARFTKPLELKKRRQLAGAPAAREWRRWCSSTPQNHRPGQLAAHIALGITWGGLVGGRGHRKGQLRVLGSPSARHTKEPRTRGAPGGRGVRGPGFFLRKSLRTYLRVLKPDCRPPGPIGIILATSYLCLLFCVCL
jgi:hypothetical protein